MPHKFGEDPECLERKKQNMSVENLLRMMDNHQSLHWIVESLGKLIEVCNMDL